MKLHDLITEQTGEPSLTFDEKNIDDLPDKDQLKYWESLANELRQVRAARFVRADKILKTRFQGTKHDYDVRSADKSNYIDFKYGYTVLSIPKNAQPSPQQVFDKVSVYLNAFHTEQTYLFELQQKAEKQAKVIKTKQRRALVQKAKKERPTDDTPVKQDPESSVPEKLSTTGKGGFSNPYFLGDSQRYAGDPEYYPFTDQMLVIYHQLKEVLKKYGVAPFTKAYGSTHSLRGGRLGSSFHRNFAIVGGNGKFIWRKYDPSPGAGQNWVIIGKHKYKTSDFLSPMYGQSRQDKLKEIK